MPVASARRRDLDPTGAGVEATRHELLEAAARLFAGRGYHHTTVEEVVSAAGVAKGTVYWYYRSKKALFLAVLERAAAEYRAELARAAAGAASPLARVARALDGTLAFARRHPNYCRLYFQEVLVDDDDFIRRRERIYAGLVGELKRTIRAAIRAGEIPSQDADLAAQMIVGAVEAAVQAVLRGRNVRAAAELRSFALGGLAHGEVRTRF